MGLKFYKYSHHYSPPYWCNYISKFDFTVTVSRNPISGRLLFAERLLERVPLPCRYQRKTDDFFHTDVHRNAYRYLLRSLSVPDQHSIFLRIGWSFFGNENSDPGSAPEKKEFLYYSYTSTKSLSFVFVFLCFLKNLVICSENLRRIFFLSKF